MRQFVPMSDDVFDDPHRFEGPLVPYRCGVPCWHQLREASPERAQQPPAIPAEEPAVVSASR
jgi:hypothetical protein